MHESRKEKVAGPAAIEISLGKWYPLVQQVQMFSPVSVTSPTQGRPSPEKRNEIFFGYCSGIWRVFVMCAQPEAATACRRANRVNLIILISLIM